MAHEISINSNGEAEAMYAGTPAWHRFGTVVEEAPNSAEAIRLAHLDWQVEKRELHFNANGVGAVVVPNKFATVRSDNNFPLGVVGKSYEVLQNVEAFDFMDSLVDQEELKYEACGALKDGQIVWVLARMKDKFFVTDDDPLMNYMLLTNGHDGSRTVSITPTNVRVVCWNTLQVALNSAQNTFHIRHSGRMKGKIEMARQALNLATSQLTSLNQILEMFSHKSASKDKVNQFLSEMFPMPVFDEKSDPGRHAKIVDRIHGVRDEVSGLFEGHVFNQTAASRGTAFGLLNSYTQWTDHERKTNGVDDDSRDETRFHLSLFGDGAKDKGQAFKTIREIFGV